MVVFQNSQSLKDNLTEPNNWSCTNTRPQHPSLICQWGHFTISSGVHWTGTDRVWLPVHGIAQACPLGPWSIGWSVALTCRVLCSLLRCHSESWCWAYYKLSAQIHFTNAYREQYSKTRWLIEVVHLRGYHRTVYLKWISKLLKQWWIAFRYLTNATLMVYYCREVHSPCQIYLQTKIFNLKLYSAFQKSWSEKTFVYELSALFLQIQ